MFLTQAECCPCACNGFLVPGREAMSSTSISQSGGEAEGDSLEPGSPRSSSGSATLLSMSHACLFEFYLLKVL